MESIANNSSSVKTENCCSWVELSQSQHNWLLAMLQSNTEKEQVLLFHRLEQQLTRGIVRKDEILFVDLFDLAWTHQAHLSTCSLKLAATLSQQAKIRTKELFSNEASVMTEISLVPSEVRSCA